MDTDESIESKEETKQTIKGRRKPQDTNKIINVRSESRKQYMKISTKDPRTRLQEMALKQAKERRQNITKDNRASRLEEVKISDPKQLAKIIAVISTLEDSDSVGVAGTPVYSEVNSNPWSTIGLAHQPIDPEASPLIQVGLYGELLLRILPKGKVQLKINKIK